MASNDDRCALFDRAWAIGAQIVIRDRVSALTYLADTKPTLREFQNSRGKLMSDRINLVRLGVLRLHEVGHLREP